MDDDELHNTDRIPIYDDGRFLIDLLTRRGGTFVDIEAFAWRDGSYSGARGHWAIIATGDPALWPADITPAARAAAVLEYRQHHHG
ncbi:hypothetical protein [uncultured Sphingomonas sp.]|uniref:hypothetical protein n=1 Tax=uncultured Sphingomonas sp. TaxID=158754 RepID=UPI0025DC0513|nr:hypothetical protein [uncultured Sphingomonas sp.]